MTGRPRLSKPAAVAAPPGRDLVLQEIRRCLENIYTLAGEDARNEKAAGGTAWRPRSIKKLAEEALSLLGRLSCSRTVEGAPEKKTPFSISSACVSAAGKTAADKKTFPVTVEIDPSVPALVEGDLSGLEHMLEETIKKPQERKGRRFPCTPWPGGTFRKALKSSFQRKPEKKPHPLP